MYIWVFCDPDLRGRVAHSFTDTWQEYRYGEAIDRENDALRERCLLEAHLPGPILEGLLQGHPHVSRNKRRG